MKHQLPAPSLWQPPVCVSSLCVCAELSRGLTWQILFVESGEVTCFRSLCVIGQPRTLPSLLAPAQGSRLPRGVFSEMATWNHTRFRQRKEKLRVSFPYSAPFAIPQLGFAFWFSCTYMRHLVYSQPLLLLILGVWWVAIEEGGKKIMQGMKLIK